MTHTTTEERLRPIIATPWLNYAKRIKASDEELKVMKALIDLSTIQIADFLEKENELARAETLDIISEEEGWEQTRNKYAAQLGLRWVYTDRFHSQEDTKKQDNNN